MTFLLLLTFAVVAPSARAITPGQRCGAALAALTAKGPRHAVRVWRHFRDDDTVYFPLDTPTSRREWQVQTLKVLGMEQGRPLHASDAVPIARALIADPRTPRLRLLDAITLLRTAEEVPNAAGLITALRLHPNLRSPAQALRIALNPASHLSPSRVADLVMDVLDGEIYEDVSENDVPRSAAPAAVLVELQNEGRLAIGDFGRAFVHLIDNPRAGEASFYWILGDLAHWAEGLYVYGRPLPPPDLVRTLVAKARARTKDFTSRRDALEGFLVTIERVLDPGGGR